MNRRVYFSDFSRSDIETRSVRSDTRCRRTTTTLRDTRNRRPSSVRECRVEFIGSGESNRGNSDENVSRYGVDLFARPTRRGSALALRSKWRARRTNFAYAGKYRYGISESGIARLFPRVGTVFASRTERAGRSECRLIYTERDLIISTSRACRKTLVAYVGYIGRYYAFTR